MEIAPTPLAQIMLGRDGREYEVSGEAGRIAARVTELDPSLRVRFNEGGMYFVIYQLLDRGKLPVSSDEDATGRALVMRVPMDAWDDRVIKELEPRAFDIRHGVSRAAVLDADLDRKHADADYRIEQLAAERAYPLFRAFQKGIFGSNPRAFIKNGLTR